MFKWFKLWLLRDTMSLKREQQIHDHLVQLLQNNRHMCELVHKLPNTPATSQLLYQLQKQWELLTAKRIASEFLMENYSK